MIHREQARRGQTLILMTVFIGFLFAVSALAFDLGFAMLVRAKLVSAVDAATMSAIRFVPQGASAMSAAAQRTFEANLPSGQFLLTNATISAPAMTTSNGSVEVRVAGSVDVPLFFARIFGRDSLTIRTATVTARRDRNVMLVLDYSGSVQPVLGDIKVAAKAFVNSFSDTFDQVGLVIFSTSGRIQVAPQKPFKANLNTQIDAITDQFLTNHTSGLYWAHRALLELPDPIKGLKSNEIVLFTDGEANWFPGQFNVSTAGGCPTSPVSGVIGWRAGGSHYSKVLSLEAPSNFGRPPVTPDCNSWPDGASYLQSIQPIWFPPPASTGTPIFPAGVSLAGFKNGTPDFGSGAVTKAERIQIAKNSADNIARLIRRDAGLSPRIHTIGYQGNEPVRVDVLERIANCDGCPNVDAADAADSSQMKGRFVTATNSAQLLTAFLDVAGFIGRIVQ